VVAVSSGGADDAPVLELARFESNGALDTSFGTAGVLLLDRGTQDSNSLAQQPDGKILAGAGLLVARVNSDGSLDTTFGTGGFAPVISPASAIVLQSTRRFCCPPAATNANGTLDSSFGHQGGVVTNFSSVGPASTPSDVAIESNGDIIVAGQVGRAPSITNISSPASFALTRYTPIGALDSTFGARGKVVTSFGKTATAGIVAVAIDGEGMLVAVGNVAPTGTTGSIVVARYLTK